MDMGSVSGDTGRRVGLSQQSNKLFKTFQAERDYSPAAVNAFQTRGNEWHDMS